MKNAIAYAFRLEVGLTGRGGGEYAPGCWRHAAIILTPRRIFSERVRFTVYKRVGLH
jgi:hypothetical protein